MSVPNQKIVTIAPRVSRDRNHLYAQMNIDALQMAISTLNGSGLKMWLYFNKNQNNFKFELSQKACQEFGIKKDSYYNGIKELMEKGYLILTYVGSNHFRFYETPHKSISKDKNWFSEESIVEVESPKKSSENTERNNINNTLQYKNNTEDDSDNFLEKMEAKSKKQMQELEEYYPNMNEIQQRLFLIARNRLDSFPIVGISDFEKQRKIEIINTAYNKIYNEEVS